MARKIHNTMNFSMNKRLLKRYSSYLGLGLVVVMFLVYLTTDTCHSKWHLQLLCAEYERSNIAGEMCYELCVLKTFRPWSCSKDNAGNLMFAYNATSSIKFPDRHSKFSAPPKTFDELYLVPEHGVTMDEFRQMVEETLDEKLGAGDHSLRVHALMNIADVNKDDKVSLSEARTLWALLKQNEFLVLSILHENAHVPHIHRFCGEAYQVTNLPPSEHRSLYHRNGGLGLTLFPSSYTWGFPNWVDRGKIAVGFMEFALDIFQHHNDGSFYMCNINETNVGYSDTNDFLMVDFTKIFPKGTMDTMMKGRKCSEDSDCTFSNHCTTICDQHSGQCTGELVKPNLALVCNILSPFILPGIPKVIRADFLNMIFRCTNLSTRDTNFEVQHSLIINDLRSLLWRQISSQV